jgi:endonuclease YncB( thermonuclease family)
MPDVQQPAPAPTAAAQLPVPIVPPDAQPPAAAAPPDTGLAGPVPPASLPGPDLAPPPAVQPADAGQSAAATPPPLPAPVSLDHPSIVDTARLTDATNSVTLFGIVGLPGEAAQGMQAFLASAGNRVLCQARTGADYVCLLPNGTDLAEVALINGAARAKDDAPAAYHDQEAAAQAARRGIWVNLPPPPITLTHPTVRDTATLVADGHTYILDGVQGLGAPYAAQFQGYIAANGDALSCQPQAVADHYVCLLGDGTDIAKVALVNGAARVGSGAPDAYRLQQGEALAAQRGYWLHPPPDAVVAASLVVEQASACCALPPGDDGHDGVVYVAGAPTAVIEGETVFLVYAGVAGWGYYDHWHHWCDAPDRYRTHMERFHHAGEGLRGYDHGVLHPGSVHPVGVAAIPGHGAMAPDRPSGPTGGGFAHPDGAAPSPGFHPGPAAAPGFHLGPAAAPGFHPGPAAAPGFHPGPAAAPGFHPGPAAAPAVHPAAGGAPRAPAPPPAHNSGGGKNH